MPVTRDVPVRCRCGHLRGVAREVGPATANHGYCYCHDCRAYLHWLEREDLHDARGGTAIIQVARARFEVTEGTDQLQCVRLSPKGLHRWYARCCRTPIANTVPALPFVGIARGAFELPGAEDTATFGPRLSAWAGAALGGPPPGAGLTARGLVHVTRLLATWALLGHGHPTPLFDRENRPTVTPVVLSREERQRLREHPRA
ncbi:MAG: hypothetical protein HY909_31405 [Deltaproteobacteria bacterium]|nr:hypothetical protein [Deltaproteobacteria bacterium]